MTVPPEEQTDHEMWIRVIKAEGSEVNTYQPGELLSDVDGDPLGVGPSIIQSAMLGSLNLTGHEWEDLARYLIDKHEGVTEQ